MSPILNRRQDVFVDASSASEWAKAMRTKPNDIQTLHDLAQTSSSCMPVNSTTLSQAATKH